MDRKIRFAALKAELPWISERMLTLSLQELEKDNLVIREDNGTFPRKVSYQLTPSAIMLNGVLHEMYKWGAIDLSEKAP
jgi:DNA-binding HxlR family transcriptional regulator